MNSIASSRTQSVPATELNLTPLIDVLLVVLVIFMVSIPVVSRDLPMQLPGRGPVDAAPASDVPLRITMAGEYQLAGALVSASELPQQLRDQLAEHPQRRLVIASADDSDYQAFVIALAAAREAGVENIATIAR